MARRGFLDYVLGGAVGGLEGLAQKRAAEEERKRMADAAARQNMLDALTLEDRGFTEAGVRQERTKAATPAISAMLNTAMAMGRGAAPAGALPDMSVLDKTAGMYGSTPALSFKVGGKTYEKMQTNQEQKVMEEVQASQRVKASDAVKRTLLVNAWTAAGATPEQAIAYANAGVNVPANRLAAPVKKLKPWEEQGFASEKEFRAYESRNPKPASASSKPTQEELDEAEAAFNSPLRKEMAPIMSAFRTRGDKRPPQVLMLAAYRALKARSGILETLGGARPLPRSASEADAELQALNADVEARKNARKGGTSVTPVTPVAPPPAPQAPTPAPATISDAAYKQSQRGALWESIKASNPTLSDDDITAQVIRRIP